MKKLVPQKFAWFLRMVPMFLSAALLLGACVTGQSSNDPSPNPGGTPKTDIYSFNLRRQQVNQGPIPYVGSFGGQPLPIYGNLLQIQNSNAFRIGLPLAGHNSSECFGNPSAVLTLAPGSKTTPQDLKSVYGQTTPALPVVIIACIENGTAVPDLLPITLTYTHSS